MLNNETKNDVMHRAILSGMTSEVERITKEEAAAAAKRVEDRVRGMAGEIATRVCSWVDFQQDQARLTITVKLPES